MEDGPPALEAIPVESLFADRINEARSSLLPKKSIERYLVYYNGFIGWCLVNKIEMEDVCYIFFKSFIFL